MREIFKGRRFGYTIDTHASCCKGPQGVNYKVVVEFEDMAISTELIAQLIYFLEKIGVTCGS